MNVWFEIECPACGKTNWLDNGDPSDLSAPDAEACKCWECGLIIDLETGMSISDKDLESVADQGQEKPGY